jgi:HTH-type transcriptional regulator / antitoxin HipB
MSLQSVADVGRLLREHRIKRGLSQQALADKIGVSRQWLMKVEGGHDRAEVGSVLRAIKALGIRLEPTTRVRLDR